MTYDGWNDYLAAAGLASLDPLTQKEFEDEDVEFSPGHSFVPGMNTPMFAQSTFVENIRKPAHSDIAFVELGNNGYVYPLTENDMARWLTSQSLGRYYNQYLRRR